MRGSSSRVTVEHAHLKLIVTTAEAAAASCLKEIKRSEKFSFEFKSTALASVGVVAAPPSRPGATLTEAFHYLIQLVEV